MPPVLSSGGSLSFDVPSTPGAPPTIVVSQTPQTNNDIIISPSVEAERQKVVRFVAQYCISSFELPNIVIKPSFVKVLENSFESAKRLYGTPTNVNNTPLKSFSELLPTEAVLSKMIHDEASEIRLKLRAQFQATKNIGIMLVCQRLIYGNRELITVWTSFVNSAWEYEKVCIAVGEKSIELKTILACVAETYGFTSAENVYVVLDDHVNPSNRPELPSNMMYMENVVFAINNILTCAINESSIKSEIIDMIKVYHSITKDANDVAFNGTIRGFVPFRGNILDDDGQNIVNALDLFQLLKYVRTRFETLKRHPEVLSKPEVRQKLEDYKVAQNLECFLEPFFEVVQEFDADAQPHFHTILPQWHSLIHECGNGDDDDEVMAMTLASRPRRRSLRHQKSIDDEPVLQVDDSKVDLPAPPILDNNAWFNSLRQSILKQLKAWANEHINTKHMIATVLNPRMRKLPIICTDTERVTTYSYIRQYAGLIAASKQEPRAENSIEAQDYEPQKKRQNFLSKLENHGMVQDELDKYLNMQFSSHDGRCVTSFWSGAESLGKLRQYARAILPLVAAAPPLKMRYIGNQSLSTVDLSEMLLLKTAQAFTDKPKSSKS
uniref:Dimer_Tnp_hAT domain-containing protein n=1 Tax=Panagrellus redivivus TaxID=6233 RepID=A0A7E5A1F3_PANRE